MAYLIVENRKRIRSGHSLNDATIEQAQNKKDLMKKYGKLFVPELKESKEFKEGIMGGDICMTPDEEIRKTLRFELKESKEFKEGIMGGDICMIVRLRIVYGTLSFRSVRSAFEESTKAVRKSLGNQITSSFGGAITSCRKKKYDNNNNDLLVRDAVSSVQLFPPFKPRFKDGYKIPRGDIGFEGAWTWTSHNKDMPNTSGLHFSASGFIS
ncbi:unnamed protein product [Dovyalis caffra]|uniref:Uncharacterized protein n=1 Tax=Dovyalis caffra TaxID=77055 RepID=A0AAV1S562_9ROSI|nr:unnamed protein product [Dovyalis caffra]